MMMAIWKFAPAIAAGNTIVLKPSNTTPISTLMMARSLQFLPERSLQRRVRRQGHRACPGQEHNTPQGYVLDHRLGAGRHVRGRSRREGLEEDERLELGGKAPVIVFDDADVEEAVEAISVAGYFNAGQDCTAATRRARRAGRLRRLRGRAHRGRERHQAGDPDDEDVLLRTPEQPNHLERVSSVVDDARPRRDRDRGRRFSDRGYFYEPTVVSGLSETTCRRTRSSAPSSRCSTARQRRGGALGQRGAVRPTPSSCSPRTTAAPCGSAGGWSSWGASGSTRTYPSSPRCRTGLQALRLRQGPLDVRPGGLHPHKARHVQPRA